MKKQVSGPGTQVYLFSDFSVGHYFVRESVGNILSSMIISRYIVMRNPDEL